MRFVKEVLINLWLLPIALPVWVLYLWPMHAFGFLYRAPRPDDQKWWSRFPTEFYVRVPSWPPRPIRQMWMRLWYRWAGHALPGACVFYGPATLHTLHTLEHEHRHVRQWRALGPLFPLVYLLFLWTFGYEDNPLEVDARDCEF